MASHPPTPVSVVIPNARALPVHLLDSITRDGARNEIIVVRNQPVSHSHWVGLARKSDERLCSRARILHSQPGAAAARNVGWQAAEHPWVLFLDDDVRLPSGTLDAIRSRTARETAPGLICIRVRSLPAASAPIISATTSLDRGSNVRVTDGRAVALQDAWRFGNGAALLAHRSVLIATGGFKDILGAGRLNGGAEDLEFIWHAARHCSIHYYGDIVVDHADVDNLADIARKFREYGRALALLAGLVKGRDGFATIYGYLRHLSRAVLQKETLIGLNSSERFRIRRQALLSIGESIGVYLSALTRQPRNQVLCPECRPR